MSALPEKIALRRMLQSFLYRLDERIVELMGAADYVGETADTVGGSRVQFCADNIVICQDQPHVFTPCTYSLLKQFFEAPKMMLSKEDIRQEVMFDDEAREGNMRQCIFGARKELKRTGFPYRIETITRKGYRLVAE
jgi:DNA-binding response OmpR family regulator